jgi:hypothetical protein
VELQADWNEFLRTLKRHGVRFLLVGAHALAAHGRPRFTQDLDLLVEPSAANARRVADAIAEFGFAETARDWRWFTKPYRITMIGRVPLRIDVLTSISGVSFRAAWKSRVVIKTAVGEVAVLGLAQLRANKRASGRPKDLLDLALLDELVATRHASHALSPRDSKSKRARGGRSRPSSKRRAPKR